ncbi:MAG: intermembrane transport protein PqiB [Gammaproteobacteria bacterium]|nr:intermembrane transport protein PqiB [Gammaproteobacteria bacterium]NNF66525.1 intermembrane transport protein PqiB [Gammaproteobacteria bacterium]
MSDTPARVSPGPKLSAIWLVPIIAVLVGIWMVYTHWASQGPLIEISFVTGDGIEAGKTKVKRKNVEVGEVLELRLSDDAQHVVLSVRIEKHEAKLLKEDTVFWVVRPRIGKGGISGLGTLLSGAYIELSPGAAEKSARKFEGLESPPVTPIGTPGLHVTLDSDGDRALHEGDPILFHGMEVGSIEYVHFNSKERRTYYNAFIAEPFDRLITSNTHFWFSSGVSVEVSANGLRMDLAPLENIVAGGVSFGVPDGQRLGDRITERAFFTIYPRESAIYEKQYKHALQFVILFEDSIRGLKPGAPVEYRGIKVGYVVRTDIDYQEITNLLEPTAKIPVLIEVNPARLGFSDTQSDATAVYRRMQELIGGGLRGGLATGSLVTGMKYIDLQYHKESQQDIQRFANYIVIPSINGQLGQLLAGVESTLQTISELPLQEMVSSGRKALDEAALTLVEFRKSASQLEQILADPASHEMIETLNATLSSFQTLAGDFSAGSATHRELQQSLVSLSQTLQELEPLLRNLRQKPNSLIFGGSQGEDIEPKGVNQ